MHAKPLDAINVIPFVDIMLVLLTMVLTTSSLIVSGRIPIRPPQSSAAAAGPPPQELIELDAAGVVHFRGRVLRREQLEAALAPLARDTSLLIRADRSASLQQFVDVADVLARLDFARVSVQTQAR